VTTSLTEPVNDDKETQGNRIARTVRKPRANIPNGSEAQRFFLAKPGNSTGIPELGKEFLGESEVMAESFKTGLNYFVVSEWRGVADLSGRKPQLGREAARGGTKMG
jgi:hypothetical protein